MKNELTPQIAAMYLGQKCDVYWDSGFKEETVIYHRVLSWIDEGQCTVTPHLRPLSSLTEVEALELYEIRYGEAWGVDFEMLGMEVESCLERFWKEDIELYAPEGKLLIGTPAVWLKLLSWGMDIFQGIEAGWAKEIQNNTMP